MSLWMVVSRVEVKSLHKPLKFPSTKFVKPCLYGAVLVHKDAYAGTEKGLHLNCFYKVKEQYEKQSGTNPGEFKAILVSTQVVAGTNYFFKVDTGKDTYIHVRVFVPLPGSDEGPTLVSFQANKTKDDELEYF